MQSPSFLGVVMDQTKKQVTDQFLYKGRWIDKRHFRSFMVNASGEQKLANSYEEYEKMITSGIWFSEKEDIPKVVKVEKPKNGSAIG